MSQYCRAHKIPFIIAQTFGLCGRIFCDFGEEFVVYDTDGERVEDFTFTQMFMEIDKAKQDIYVETKDTIPYVDGNLVEVTDVKF